MSNSLSEACFMFHDSYIIGSALDVPPMDYQVRLEQTYQNHNSNSQYLNFSHRSSSCVFPVSLFLQAQLNCVNEAVFLIYTNQIYLIAKY